MKKIHVLARKEDLDRERLGDKAVVVVDVLFATSSIATALAHGAREVVPMPDGEAALAEARRRPAGSYLLAGELHAATLPGFLPPTPLALLREELAGRSLICSTTNGTVALSRASGAAEVYAAALLNAEAVAEHLERAFAGETALVVCAGSSGGMSLDDFYAAGFLVTLLARRGGKELSDSALAARMVHEGRDAFECLAQSAVGRLMLGRGLEEEIRFAAQKNRFGVVPKLEEGRIRAV